MDTKALRQKILDLAIRGKLVPQDPNDEPASVLLERIRAEKQKMAKEGKLKAKDIKNDSVIYKGEDNLHYEKFADGTVKCIEDEIPFEIPDNWAWCRLGNITDTIQYGLSNSAESNGTHRLLRITDIQEGKVNWDTVPFTKTNESDKYTLHINDIVFARTGATVGKSFLIAELPCESVYASYLIRIRLISNIFPQYIYQFFNSLCYWEQITGKAVGVGQPNCNGTALKELFVPLPPLNEQKQIVPTAVRLLKYADVISNEKEQLANLISSAKSKILDLAIRGKLVPQNPNDEPASVLLGRIKAEKEELIKQGKIKRDKKESTIFKGEDNSYYEKIGNEVKCIDAELPFEIPKNWSWCRMSKLMYLISGVTYNKNDVQKVGVRVLRGGNLTSANEIKLCDDDIFLPESYIDQQNQMQIGDIIIVASTGSTTVIGKPAFVESYYTKTQIGGFLKIVRPITVQTQQILWLLFRTKYYHESILDRVGGVNINNVKSAYLEDMLVPIPPKHELDLIIDEYSRLSQFVSYIEASLN